MSVPRPNHRYTARERALLRFITDKIVAYLHPLIIYCITSVYRTDTERSCLTATKDIEEWSFECDLLIVVPDDSVIDDNITQQITELTAESGTVKVIIHSLADFIQQIKERDVLLSAVYRNAAVLYETDNAARLLPAVDSTNNGEAKRK